LPCKRFHSTRILPALVALPAEAMLRKALVRPAKTPPTAGTLGEIKNQKIV
jgi:hypothetical protein